MTIPILSNLGYDLTFSTAIVAVAGGLGVIIPPSIPFIMYGMAKGGISKKLFDVFAYFLGKFTAGMPCAVIVTCLFYGAISGSAPATVPCRNYPRTHDRSPAHALCDLSLQTLR